MSADIWQSAVEMATDYEIGLHVSPEDTAKTLRDLAAEIVRLRGEVFRIAGGDTECCPNPTTENALDCLRDLRQCYDEAIAPAEAKGDGLHPETADLVARFACALSEKLAAAERKYGWDTHWKSPAWMDQCRQQLVEHVAKGDPRDVAAYCAFLWHHGERTALSTPQPAGGEAVAWRAKSAGLIQFVTDERYRKFSPEIHRYYEPFKCASCTTPPAAQVQHPAGDALGAVRDALEAAARSLRTIAEQAGKTEGLDDMMNVRGYANSRANAAEAALLPSAGEGKGHG